jgi:glycosyltransferase involved in cell wall biosynthesis
MKICYISNSASPSNNASSLQTAKLCEYMSKKGHIVKLILPNTGYKKNLLKYYNIKYKFKIKRIKNFNKFPIGINYYLYSIWAILKSNLNNQDLYLTRNFFTSFILNILNKEHILEIHDDIKIEGRIVRFLVKHVKILNLKYLIKIVTTTKTLKQKYISYGVTKKKIFVLHNASSLPSKFDKSRIKKNYKIGYFGSIFKSRGIEMIIKISVLDKKNKYFIYGGTKDEVNKIKKTVKNKNILFSPYIPYVKVKEKLKNIDICILPYTSKITVSGNVGNIANYTSPLKVFDYMKFGKLIISSNLTVLKEILVDRQNCLLIKNFNDEKEWYKVIKFVCNNFKKYEKIRRNAYNYSKKFDQDWRVSELLTFEKFSK